jgi:hypothetical protein
MVSCGKLKGLHAQTHALTIIASESFSCSIKSQKYKATIKKEIVVMRFFEN